MNYNNWHKTATTLDMLQDRVLNASSIESLINDLLESDLPFDKQKLSIVYRGYGYISPKFLAIEGKPRTSTISNQLKNDFPLDDNSTIMQIINNPNNGRVHLINKDQCRKTNFPAFKSILLVPMRLTKEKHTGVFILADRNNENSFTEFDNLLDSFANRIAHIIRHNVRKRRNQSLQLLQTHMLSNSHEFECELVEEFIKGEVGTNFKGIKQWYKNDNINILMKHPLDTKRLTLICKDGVIIPNYREKKLLTDDDIRHYLGRTSELLAEKPLVFNNKAEIHEQGIAAPCKSWVAAPLRLKSKDASGTEATPIIGYLVLFNNHTENSYEAEEATYLDIISDFLGLVIAHFRDHQYLQEINSIRQFSIENKNNESSSYKLLLQTAYALKKLYGIRDLVIYRYFRDSGQQLEPIFPPKPTSNKELDHIKDQAFKLILKTNKKQNINYKEFTISYNNIKYFVAPMRLENRSMGCFIFKAECIGDFTAESIGHISDEIGRKISNYTRWMRYPLLNQFGIRSSELNPLNQEKILEFTYKAISEIMSTDNFYVSLYNNQTNEITFPFAKKKGKTWKELQGAARKIIPNKIGKTEEIILTKKPLFHRTRKESIEWYKMDNHEEFTGNPLASWVGAPIFSEKGVIGVIATYHDELDYIYTERDVFFLQNISNQVSGLFRALELEKAKEAIIEKEALISSTLIAQDITHRLNNTLGSTIINVDQANRDIKNAVEDNNLSKLKNTIASLSLTSKNLKNLINDTNQSTKTHKQNIILHTLISKLTQQILIEKKINNNISIYTSSSGEELRIATNYFSLKNCLYSIIDNAANALKEQLEHPHTKELYIKSEIEYTEKDITIYIIDNGVPILEKIKNTMFSLGHTSKEKDNGGYGLWRAKVLIENMGGNIKYHEDNSFPDELKIFQINLPRIDPSNKQLSALIIDDEEAWRVIIENWLKEEDFKVESASNYKSAKKLIENYKTMPDLIVLDIALDPNDGGNVDGLSLIETIKIKTGNTKIVLFTGYPHKASNYLNDINGCLIEKVKNGIVINKETFTRLIKI